MIDVATGENSNKRGALDDDDQDDKENKRQKSDNETATSNEIVNKKERFVIPRPGENGAVDSDTLNDLRFVLTGLFPEVGGGTGLSLGKERTKAMIQAFGGKVTQSISGKTNYLVVGSEPGGCKVASARNNGIKMIDIRALQQLLLGQSESQTLEDAPPPVIDTFSAGYTRRGAING